MTFNPRRWFQAEVLAELVAIRASLRRLEGMEATQMATEAELKAKLDEAITEIGATKGVADSAVALLDTLITLVQPAIDANDIAQVQSVIDQVKAQRQSLADAVARDTPPAA